MITATYAGTGMETTTVTTRSTVVPSPHLHSPISTHVPVSKLIPDMDESTSDNMINSAPMTTVVVVPNPSVHITINDNYSVDDNFRFSKPLTTYTDASSIGSINETFVQDNGVVVTAL